MTEQADIQKARDFFASDFGLVRTRGSSLWKNRRFGPLTDGLFDLRLRLARSYSPSVLAAETPRLNVLVVGVRSNSAPDDLDRLFAAFASERHGVEFRSKAAGNQGKLANVNDLVAQDDVERFDWIIMTDDDVVVERGFVDLFLAICHRFAFKIAMPAHRFGSFSGYEVTRRQWATIARQTNYVEVGPVTAFHRATFADVFPLPVLKYGWGLDVHWSYLSRQRGWTIGVVDGTPIRHYRPIGRSYSRSEATDEACDYIARRGHLPREETFSTVRAHRA